MIIDDLYSTQSYYYMGDTVNQYRAQATASTFGTSPLLSVDSYFLGYINKSNLPYAYGMSVVYYDEEGNLIFKDITDDANFPCGYALVQQSLGEEQHFLYYKVNDTTTYAASPRTRMLNQNYPMYSGRSMYKESVAMNFGFTFVAYDGGGNIINPDNYAMTAYCNFETVGQALNFLRGNSSVYVDIMNYQSDTITVRIDADNMADGNAYLESESGGYFVRLLITSFDCTNGCSAYNGGSTPTAFRPQFMAKVTGEYKGDNYEVATCGSSHNPSISLNYLESLDPDEDNPFKYYRCRLEGEFADSQISDLYLRALIFNGNVCLARFRNSIDVSMIHDMAEISHAFYLAYRGDISTNNYTTGYVRGVTYATDVSPNDEFLAQWKTGDLSDETFKNSLREWQYVDSGFQSNDFTEEDVPEPEPEPGDDDDPGSDEPVETPLMTGDNQELQLDRTLTAPNDFITMYNITPPMLSIFGRTLWKSIIDYDPQDPTSVDIFKNFFAILNEEVTGTLDIGAILQFVVSLRQYPFAVSSLGITESVGNSIKIGTGKVPISLGVAANVQKLTSTIGLIDCGTVTIADYRDFKLYNDFRDYLNATVTAFLPYCGSVELNPIEVIHNTVHCYYAIDFYTGECTAYLTTTDDSHTVLSAIKNGTIGVLIPMTATNSGQVAARHTVDNAKDSGLIVSNLGNLFGAIANAAQGNIAGIGSSVMGLATNSIQQRQLQAERQGRSAVLAPSLSGGSGAAAFYQPACPSIVVRRGTYARDKINNYPSSCAYPSTISGTLRTFIGTGYTECYNVDCSGIHCTDEEKAEIKLILETGCYL